MKLDARDQARLEGKEGPAIALAMRLVTKAADIMGATSLIDVSFAHLDSCFYAGRAHLDFAKFLQSHKTRFAVPTWTNNGVVSLEDPSLRPIGEDTEMVEGARALMEVYADLGCKPVFTCAPYQLPGGPKRGDHIVVGESNAVSYYNAVTAARTNKYGAYLDVACALIGKAPFAGLHTEQGRRGDILFTLENVPDSLKQESIFCHLIGHHVGMLAGRQIPVIEGLSPTTNVDGLKAISAAAASSGGVEHWHGIGITPEAPDLATAFGGKAPKAVHKITRADLRAARNALSAGRDGPLDMVQLGTPHFSPSEFANLLTALAGRRVKVPTQVSTSRFVRDFAQTHIAQLEKLGVSIVTDTCTYYSPRARGVSGRIMTNAAKWAWYAPGMLGVEAVFGSLKECAESAVRGDVWRDKELEL
jgi:predicted aconitase